jgi:hypothetical protein
LQAPSWARQPDLVAEHLLEAVERVLSAVITPDS